MAARWPLAIWLAVAACGGGGDDVDVPICTIVEPEIAVDGDVEAARLGEGMSAGPDVDGDGYPDVVAGAPYDDIDEQVGTARLLSGATGETLHTWQSDLAGDLFGFSVALGGDVDGDGRGDVLIGAPHREDRRGRVTLFSGATGEEIRSWEGPAAFSDFGYSVSFGADVDGDTAPDVLVGAPLLEYDPIVEDGVERSRQGRVYLYSGFSGAMLRWWDAPERNESEFGTVVILGPDADGDARGDVVVTEPGWGSTPGRAFLYSGSSGELLHQWPDTPVEEFGWSAALGGDVDGDGLADVAFAAVDIFGQTDGIITVHSGATGETLLTVTEQWDFVGSLEITPDLDGDGRSDLLVGLPRDVARLMSSADGSSIRTFRTRDFGTRVSFAEIAPCGLMVAVSGPDASSPDFLFDAGGVRLYVHP